MDDDSELIERWALRGWLAFVFCVVLGVIAALSGWIDILGQFGDSFGWINSVASSAAAIFALYAVLIQQRELKEARRSADESAKAQADLVRLQALLAIRMDTEKMLKKLRSSERKLRDEFRELETFITSETHIPAYRPEDHRRRLRRYEEILPLLPNIRAEITLLDADEEFQTEGIKRILTEWDIKTSIEER